MTGIAKSVTMNPGNENSSVCRVQRFQPANMTTNPASATSNVPPIRLAIRSAFSEKACPSRSSTDRRHIRTPAEINSTTLSSPNAISTRLPEATPATVATMASTAIQPIVSHSRRNASRISGLRSTADLVGKTKRDGTQHASAQDSASFAVRVMKPSYPSNSRPSTRHCPRNPDLRAPIEVTERAPEATLRAWVLARGYA